MKYTITYGSSQEVGLIGKGRFTEKAVPDNHVRQRGEAYRYLLCGDHALSEYRPCPRRGL